MGDDEMKERLRAGLQSSRDSLLWKLEGLSERDLRFPRTPTGLTLLGIIKHMAQVEIGYFGDTFDRPWPDPSEIIASERFEAEPQADWYATADETAADLIDLYRRVWIFADETIDSLPLDAPGIVPHWPEPRNRVTLQQIMIHVLIDLTRHLGQADVVREGIDGQIGMRPNATNIPDGQDWAAYVSMLAELAEGAESSSR